VHPTGKIGSFVYALVLVGCACFAGSEVFGFAFAIGDGDGKIGLGIGAFFIATLAGAVGLVIAAIGSWTRSRAVSLIALAGALLVLPSAVLFCRAQGGALWHNSQVGFNYGPLAWASVLLPLPLDLAALLLSGLRFQHFNPSHPEPLAGPRS
jgi:hypothetical protein